MAPIFCPAICTTSSRRKLVANFTLICWPMMPHAQTVEAGGQQRQPQAPAGADEGGMAGLERGHIVGQAEHPAALHG